MTGTNSKKPLLRLAMGGALLLALAAAPSLRAAPSPWDDSPFGAGAEDDAPEMTNPVTLRAVGPSKPVAAGSEAAVEVHFDIIENAYVNNEMTRVTLSSAEGVKAGEAVFPEPILKDVPSLGKVAQIYKHSAVVRVPVQIDAAAAAGERKLTLSVRYQACNDQVCFIPKTERLDVTLKVAGASAGQPIQASYVVPQAAPGAGIRPPAGSEEAAPRASAAGSDQDEFARQLERGMLFAFLFAFLGGILASLTPCVYPMIPITIAVIGARGAQSRRAAFVLSLLFVLGIAIVYSILGVTAAATGGIFGSVLQSPYVVGFVSLVFVVLAMSMLGFYDMNLPPAIANRLNSMGGKGHGGALVVGMVTGIVASPCVGPVLVGMLGWIATIAADPAYSRAASLGMGFSLMFTFAAGMGLLFLLIGTFTGLIVSLPRSGAWMVRVKHLLGTMLFGVAWYFALPLLPVWLPALLLAPGMIYLASGELEHARERRFAGAWMAAASTYLLLLGASAVFPGAIRTGWAVEGHGAAAVVERVEWVRSEPEGLMQASRERKLVMIDFFAEWCIACKELDRYTYSDEAVGQALEEKFVSVKLDGTDESNAAFNTAYRKYGVRGLPTVLFLTPDGRVLPRWTLTGFEGPEDFLRRLEAVEREAATALTAAR
jgi:thioredoxin:protein disulfide reductase